MLTLDDVAGLERQKKFIQNNLVIPYNSSELYSALVLEPDKLRERKTFLLHGPPGTGKSLFAQAVANEIGVPYKSFHSTEFLKSLVGEGSKTLRSVYQNHSGVIFLDEIDAIGKNRSLSSSAPIDDVLLELLVNIDGINSNYDTITFAATNRFDVLDPALISRFSYDLKFDLPDRAQREKIIEKKLSYYNHKINSLGFLIDKTEGSDGRAIDTYFMSARNNALVSKRPYLLKEDFEVKL